MRGRREIDHQVSTSGKEEEPLNDGVGIQISKLLSALLAIILLVGCLIAIVFVINGGIPGGQTSYHHREIPSGIRKNPEVIAQNIEEQKKLGPALEMYFAQSRGLVHKDLKITPGPTTGKPEMPVSPSADKNDFGRLLWIPSKTSVSPFQHSYPVPPSSVNRARVVPMPLIISVQDESSEPPKDLFETYTPKIPETQNKQTQFEELVEDANGSFYEYEDEVDEDAERDVEEEEEEEEESAETNSREGPPTPLNFGDIFDMAMNFFGRTNQSEPADVQGVIRMINETVNKNEEGSLITKLNRMYEKPSLVANPLTSLVTGKHENSLTAFLFMSFGVFLLSQIHNLVKGTDPEQKARSVSNKKEEEVPSPNMIDILFRPPLGNTTGGEEEISSRALGEDPGSVNNGVRALLNIGNAWSRNPKALECIWSLYCQDLDRTAGKEGLYSVSARINSVGLRLIMAQIPPELTFDVMLRSLLRWEGLPCQKMFPCGTELNSLQSSWADVNPHNKTGP